MEASETEVLLVAPEAEVLPVAPELLPPWERLAPLAIVVLLIRNIQQGVRQNLSLIAGAGAGVALFDRITLQGVLAAAGVGLALIVAGSVLYHQRFRYRVERDAVRVRKGVLVRREVRIPLSRVQNVRLLEPLYFRPFGLLRVALETPGASETELELPGIRRAQGEALRRQVLKRDEGADADGAIPHTEVANPAAILHHAPEPELLFTYGVATNRVLLLALAYGAYALGTWAEQIADWQEGAMETLPSLMTTGPWNGLPTPVLIALVLVVLGVGLTALSGVLALIRFHGFRLEESATELVARGGLLERIEQALRRDKIRGIRFQQGPLGRLLGVGALHGTQTTSGGVVVGAEGPRSKQTFLVPALRPSAFPALAAVLLPGAVPPHVFHAISPRFRRSLGLRLLPVVGLAGILLWRVSGLPAPLALGLPLLALGGIHLRWRQWGWARAGTLLWVRQGFLGLKVEAFPAGRVQGVVILDSPVQRRYGLRTLELTFPQGSTTIPFLLEGDAVALANDLLNPAHRVGAREI